MLPDGILQHYGLDGALIVPFGSGLINHTWHVTKGGEHFILQKINDKVFTDPSLIDENLSQISEHLAMQHPGYVFTNAIKSRDGHTLLNWDNGYYRLFRFVPGSHSKEVAASPAQAYAAAAAFGKFTCGLKDLDAGTLHITLKNFHNLTLRYEQFENALLYGNPERIKSSGAQIKFLQSQKGIADEFENIKSNPDFRLRVTHHDTKISNVLFDDADNVLCVIDLDTVMPGYFISDVGDMMRTYLSPEGEETESPEKIVVRDEYYRAIVAGYYSQMKDVLTATEKEYFYYAGKFMIYMQALRFLTDHLNDDVYYGARYEGHNFVRAQNQIILLKAYLAKEQAYKPVLESVI